MAKKASFKTVSRSGESVTVYGELTKANKVTDWNGNDITPPFIPQVRVWTKYANYGLYNLDRFEGGVLTSKSFQNLMMPDKDN